MKKQDYQAEIDAIRDYMGGERFEGIVRLYSAGQIAEQRGLIRRDYTVAREAAEGFYSLLRQRFESKGAVTTFGPYSPGQVTAMKRAGIEGIYLGGWATSAKGSTHEDPGSDVAGYPLSQVPDEAEVLVRALLAADKNQRYLRAQMSDLELQSTPEFDYRPFIIADADTGHGGDPHVRNLIRRFVEAGVPGYHIEDQRPGTKKCGHQGGKVLVAVDEQIKRLNTARFQLDVMGVPGIIVARTDAEAATLLDGRSDERDQAFILGSTNLSIPTYKVVFLSLIKLLHEAGLSELNGHLLYAISDSEYEAGLAWIERTGIADGARADVARFVKNKADRWPERILDKANTKLIDAWAAEAGVKTYREAVAAVIEFRLNEGDSFEMSLDEWNEFAATASFAMAKKKAKALGVHPVWDCEHAKTPEGFYQVRGGIEYAIQKSLAVAPFADILWMETKTADLKDAKVFADAIHARFPNKMLAYNLSPSFNWDSTGMSEQEMRRFPEELGKLGFVFNFITYGGHQIDGVAGEDFSRALLEEGMLALAKVQRKLRLVESPYKTPQTLVGGPRFDAALAASSGRTATTKAMGKGSTQHQHLILTEVPPSLLGSWLGEWSRHHEQPPLRVSLRPHSAGSSLLQLEVSSREGKVAYVVFDRIQDRNGKVFLSIRNQQTFDLGLRRKRLMALLELFLVHRYKAESVHFVSPTEDSMGHAKSLQELAFFSEVKTEIGDLIVANLNAETIDRLVSDADARRAFIGKA